jgi:hypothetical protein
MTTSTTRRVALAAGVLSVAVVGVTGLASSALFTSQDSVTGSSFAAGTVDIAAGTGSAVFSVDTSAPGSVAYGALTVANDGSLAMRYAMSTSAEGDLAAELDATVLRIAADETCDADATGDVLYTGDLASAGFGSSSAGADLGDRTIDAAGDESLCFAVSLPSTVGNSAQGDSATASFTFDAEQTLNN